MLVVDIRALSYNSIAHRMQNVKLGLLYAFYCELEDAIHIVTSVCHAPL